MSSRTAFRTRGIGDFGRWDRMGTNDMCIMLLLLAIGVTMTLGGILGSER